MAAADQNGSLLRMSVFGALGQTILGMSAEKLRMIQTCSEDKYEKVFQVSFSNSANSVKRSGVVPHNLRHILTQGFDSKSKFHQWTLQGSFCYHNTNKFVVCFVGKDELETTFKQHDKFALKIIR